jgi:hypothetical protein
MLVPTEIYAGSKILPNHGAFSTPPRILFSPLSRQATRKDFAERDFRKSSSLTVESDRSPVFVRLDR